jgi:hypothetical protein
MVFVANTAVIPTVTEGRLAATRDRHQGTVVAIRTAYGEDAVTARYLKFNGEIRLNDVDFATGDGVTGYAAHRFQNEDPGARRYVTGKFVDAGVQRQNILRIITQACRRRPRPIVGELKRQLSVGTDNTIATQRDRRQFQQPNGYRDYAVTTVYARRGQRNQFATYRCIKITTPVGKNGSGTDGRIHHPGWLRKETYRNPHGTIATIGRWRRDDHLTSQSVGPKGFAKENEISTHADNGVKGAKRRCKEG